jgi:hypothetical protein
MRNFDYQLEEIGVLNFSNLIQNLEDTILNLNVEEFAKFCFKKDLEHIPLKNWLKIFNRKLPFDLIKILCEKMLRNYRDVNSWEFYENALYFPNWEIAFIQLGEMGNLPNFPNSFNVITFPNFLIDHYTIAENEEGILLF